MTDEFANTRKQLSVVAALLLVGYLCHDKLRFSSALLHLASFCVYHTLPFFAVRPVLHLHQRPKIVGLTLLSPILLVSSLLLLGRLVGFTERARTLQTVQIDGNTIELQRYENGGALGIHGINVEQRRSIVPGLYLVRSIAFFDDAKEAVFSMELPYVLKVHAVGSYSSNDYQVDKTCLLKPWVYF